MADEWAWERTDNDTAKWNKLDVSSVQSGDTPIPFDLLINRYKSSSPDSEEFVHDPLTSFIRAAEEGAGTDEAIEVLKQIDDSWTVTTTVSNHDKTLSASHVYVVIAVHAEAKHVTATTVKQPPDGK